MSSFDPKAAFQAEFERIKLAASRRQPAKEKEKLKPLLLELLQKYRLKLPLEMVQERTVEEGAVLHSIGEHEAALRSCYDPILAAAADGGLALAGAEAIRLGVEAEYGAVTCSFALQQARDPCVHDAASTATVGALLKRLVAAMRSCTADPNLYWLVFNGTVRIYEVCRALMRPERAGGAIEPLAWCALCLEGSVPLLQPRFLKWRVQVAVALCHCYEATGQREPAQAAAAHALEQLAAQRALDRHNPVPPKKKLVARYEAAERKLRALKLKYEWLGGGGGGERRRRLPRAGGAKEAAAADGGGADAAAPIIGAASRSRASEATPSRSSPRCSKRCKTMRRRSVPSSTRRRPRSAPPS